jgi:hypothetical protein
VPAERKRSTFVLNRDRAENPKQHRYLPRVRARR